MSEAASQPRDARGRFTSPPGNGRAEGMSDGAVSTAILARLADAVAAIANLDDTRWGLSGYMGKSYDGERKLYDALGYPRDGSIKYKHYLAKYKRARMASAVVNVLPEYCWGDPPEISDDSSPDDTEFEKQVDEVIERVDFWSKAERADKLARIGKYSAILLGFDDTADSAMLAQEVSRGAQLGYVMPYSEDNAQIEELDTDPSSPRYGLPLLYKLNLSAASDAGGSGSVSRSPKGVSGSPTVHWTRVVHVAENLLESDVFALNILEPIFNDLIDVEKVVGGAAEMFWRNARRPLVFTATDGSGIPSDEELTKVEEQIERLIHDLKDYIVGGNFKAEAIAPDVKSPKDHVDAILMMVAAATGYPKRALMGAELGELSSSADERRFVRKVQRRDVQHCERRIIRPAINRLIEFGSVSEPGGGKYAVVWPAIVTPSDEERAKVAKAKAEAMKAYVESGAERLVAPEMFLRSELGYDDDDIAMNNTLLGAMIEETDGRRPGEPTRVEPPEEGDDE